ncbi:hypothetical protein [Nitrosomonas sp.]|uniref:hypothetical protein n=1 Tax=Nitrosomonas sp. TaxID=42353 RepID=UPI00374D7F4B
MVLLVTLLAKTVPERPIASAQRTLGKAPTESRRQIIVVVRVSMLYFGLIQPE